MDLFKVDTVTEVMEKIKKYYEDITLETEEIHIAVALGRVVGEDIYSPIDLPEFHRSTVDGYAVLAKDTFGASESLPTFLDMAGRVEMGEDSQLTVTPGKAVYVPTGGMIPQGADGVVMIEYVEKLDEGTIAVYHPIAPWDGIIRRGEDLQKGMNILRRGHRLKPQDIGALAAIGITNIKVFMKPRIAIISTGDEIVEPSPTVAYGQIRDINTYALAALAEEVGAEVTEKRIVKDDYEQLRSIVAEALYHNHITILSGGSSVGMKDVTAKVIDSLGEPGVFVHGVAIKPGKPTIMGKIKNRAVFGLPGHPVSAILVFKVFVIHLIQRLYGQEFHEGFTIHGICANNVPSSPGKETYQMVSIEEIDGEYVITPIHGKSGAISLLTKSQGYIKIHMNKEGIKKGERVRVYRL